MLRVEKSENCSVRHQPRHRPVRDAGVPVAADCARGAAARLVLAAGGAAARFAAVPAAPAAAGARAVSGVRQPRVLAVPDPRQRLHDPRAGAADGGRGAGPHRRHRSRHPAGRLRVDAHARRRRQPVAAVDALPARRSANRWRGKTTAWRWRCSRTSPRRRCGSPRIRTPSSSSSITSRRSRRSGSKTTPRWDTNIELGIAWGMRLIEKDTELYGKSPNAKAFVLVTDGQAWSGEVARALKTARTNDVPVWVVGVGTTVGAFIPEPERKPNDTSPREPPIRASLDRASLMHDRQRRRRRVPGARSRRRPRDLQPHHRRGAQARRIARARGRQRRALLAVPARRGGVHGASACCSCRRRPSCGCRRPARPSR